MGKTVWDDGYIIDAYNLAKNGTREGAISKALGISLPTFLSWERKKKAFKTALDRGRAEFRKREKDISFRDYVYQRLSPDLRRVWRDVNKLDKLKKGGEQIEAIFSKRGKRVRQHLFLYALVHCNFAVSAALRKVNMSKGALEDWKKDDPDFAKIVEEMQWHKKNFFESYLCNLVARGDSAATIFANKTFNRDRGYGEKLDINMSGEVTQNIKTVDALNLPISIRKEILKSIRKPQQA